MIKYLSEELLKRKDQIKPFKNQLKFILCDERFVPVESSDSTFGEYVTRHLFSGLEIPTENVYPINTNSKTVDECATDYENRLKPLLNDNKGFDILLFGCGPDGHTASLFPGHRLFTQADNYNDRIVVSINDSPKPPPERITLTLNCIRKSTYLLFLAGGESKAEILKKILTDKDLTLPCTNIVSTVSHGVIKWFVDKDAAKLL
jgi:6-phosphogluconolactonase